jgi:hypothetical protein
VLQGENQRNYLVFWENVSPEATRVLLNKKLFGHKIRDKFYPGVAQQYELQRLGKGCIAVSFVSLKPVLEVFNLLNVPYKVMRADNIGEITEPNETQEA